jgi:hypothetical protein
LNYVGDSILALIFPLEFQLVSLYVKLGLKIAFAKILHATDSQGLSLERR